MFSMGTVSYFLTIFASQVLSIIKPPYSVEFGSVFLPLVQNQDIAGPLINAEATDVVSQFIGKVPVLCHVTVCLCL